MRYCGYGTTPCELRPQGNFFPQSGTIRENSFADAIEYVLLAPLFHFQKLD
jgi:hypothetical protein